MRGEKKKKKEEEHVLNVTMSVGAAVNEHNVALLRSEFELGRESHHATDTDNCTSTL